MAKRKNRSSSCLFPAIFLVLLAAGVLAAIVYVPVLAEQTFGSPSPALGLFQRTSYAFRMLLNAGDLTVPPAMDGVEKLFAIAPGETVPAFSARLEQTGIIRDAKTFQIYLIWTGMDTSIQAGSYTLTPRMTGIEVAQALQSVAPGDAILVMLAGWRLEEVIATLPTTGLDIPAQNFWAAIMSVTRDHPDLFPPGVTAEGFLFPDTYILPRETSAEQLLSLMVQNFSTALTRKLKTGFERQGLSIYQAVTLASIVEREAIFDDEMPTIASVFFNRLASGMTLGSDPTIQYALGYNAVHQTWWTNPLSWADLEVQSLYNTYTNPGLPPGPICSPSLAALEAVSSPVRSEFYYFQARCDGSGRHVFEVTWEEHQKNLCP